MKMLTPFQYRKLRGRIVEVYSSQREFADIIHVAPLTVTNKLNGKTEFSQSDILTWSAALNIPKEEYCDYFFA